MEQVTQVVNVSSDLGAHTARLAEYAELGFGKIFLHHVGQEQEAFVARVRREGPPPAEECGMRLTQTSDLWWKNAVVYCLDVETYADGNGDGCGDFRGLIQQIDHLHRLGVTCIWLMPFYPSPDTRRRLRHHRLLRRRPAAGHARRRSSSSSAPPATAGMRVIADLVVNHTSDEHPWFLEARSSRDSPKRDWYIWSDEEPADAAEGVVFPDKETSIWELDEKTGQYYLHQFYKFQPDLNVANPEVRDEIARIMGFWTQLGLSGFRVDAVNFLIETKRQQDKLALPDPHDYLADLSRVPAQAQRGGGAARRGQPALSRPDAVLRRPRRRRQHDELTMCFDFIGMQAMYLSLARGDAGPLTEALKQRPQPPEDGHWATFVRNHDELTLDKLSEAQRQEVFDAFGPEKDMQLYGRGIRRRLPPMLDGDQRRIRLVYSLLFALPGTPVLFYGEEIGLGDNLAAEGRLAVRVPMQWTSEPGGGFSTADPSTFPEPRSPRARSARAGQRPRPVARPRLAPVVLPPPRRVLPRVPRAGLGHGAGARPRPGRGVGAGPPRDVDGVSMVALHNFGDRKVTAALPLKGLGGVRAVRRARRGRVDGDGRRRRHAGGGAAAVRLPLAALVAVSRPDASLYERPARRNLSDGRPFVGQPVARRQGGTRQASDPPRGAAPRSFHSSSARSADSVRSRAISRARDAVSLSGYGPSRSAARQPSGPSTVWCFRQ